MKSSQREQFYNVYYTRLISAILFCMLFTIMLFWIVIQTDIRSTEKRFLGKAETAIAQLQHQLDSSNALITALTGWHHSRNGYDTSELTIFTQEMLSSYPHIYSVQFLPKIEHAQRKKFEEEMHNDGYASFHIKEKSDAALSIASERPNYYPITYVKPLTPQTASLLGFDMKSLPTTAQALDLAINSGATSGSLPVDILLQGKSFYLLKAAYKGNLIPENETQRREQVVGVYAVAILTSKLLDDIRHIMDNPATHIALDYEADSAINNTILTSLQHTTSWSTLLPIFKIRSDLQQIKQPFVLKLERQLEISDISIGTLASIFLVASLLVHLINLSLRRDLQHSIARELSQDDIFREKELAEVTLNSIADGVITTDTHNRVEHMNPIAERLCGHSFAEARKQPLKDILHLINKGSGRADLHAFTVPALDKIGEAHATYLLKQHQGTEYTVRISAAPIRNRDGLLMGSVIVFRDISKEQKMAEMLTYQARHDELTGLYNRREFEYQLRRSLDKASTSKLHDVLCYVDLDQFKLVNDTCGHMAGDELLKQISQRLKQQLRSDDVLARLGGDEFGVIIHHSHLKDAMEIAANLQAVIRDHRFIWQGKIFDVGSSMGLVQITHEIGSIEELMIAADSACYMAKDKGRNRIVVHAFDDQELQQRHGDMQWTHRIRDALENEKICLYLQAVKPLQDHAENLHYEVLLRMLDEDDDIISPSSFIPAAERYNVMPELDKWVIRHAFELIASHPNQDDIFNINLSGKSISDETLLGYIMHEFQRTGINSRRICFEITETAAIANLSSASELIEELRLIGCQFALDDFGSGLSSYSYLKRLPVDYLKIDGSFVRDMLHDPIDHAMVASIVQVGHVIGIKTIAEFVENQDIENALRKLGVDYAQGYGIHRPSPWQQVTHAVNDTPLHS